MKSSIKWIYFLFLILISIVLIFSCDVPAENPNTYTITYDANFASGGTVPANQTKTHGENITLAPNSGSLVRTGYEFGGWNTKADGSGTNYAAEASFAINADTTLYAKWNANSYTITYHLAGGENHSDNPDTYTTDTETFSLKTPSREGYDFLGWYDEESGGNVVTQIAKGSIGGKIVYARWGKSYSIGEVGPAGGLIFYDQGSYSDGWRYLEAAPAGWSGVSDPFSAFGFYRPDGSDILVGTSTDKGTGKSNTEALVDAMGEEAYLNKLGEVEDKGNYAAKLASDYIKTVDSIVYDDWFLPSKDELNEMYENLHEHSSGGLDGAYWSSSEYFITSAYFQNLSNGESGNSNRSGTHYVRPVRAF